ncbi:MAG: glutamate--tRNA ligase [Candidatus Woesearchaeota archaeon]
MKPSTAKIKEAIRKWALQNAITYKYQANVGAVLGKILAELPELKEEAASLRKLVSEIVAEINAMPPDKQLDELKRIAPELLEKKPKTKEKELEALPNATKGKVVMRFAPSPSGPLHIGHALVLSLNSEYCRLYDGKLILRIEDTNPENIYEPAYRMIPEEANWLTKGNIAKVVFQSDRLHTYYDYAEKIIAAGKGYVCTCNPDSFRELIAKKKACPCRELPIKEQLLRWDRMFSGYEPGEAVVRIKTDLNDPNPAMRDWPALRINHTVHPRTGTSERVWPLMNFAVAIDDHELGITHTIRGKDHMDNAKRQSHIFDIFGWEKPTHLYFGRINFTGLELSSSATKALIAQGKYSGWDDIRLPFIAALRRRGYQPDAFIRYAIDIGISLADKSISAGDFFKALDAHNREIVDKIANRYFFVENPIKIEIANVPELSPRVELHPDFLERGFREFIIEKSFYISSEDFATIKPDTIYRLIGCLNFIKKGKRFVFDSASYDAFWKQHGKGNLHWLPADGPMASELVKVEVIMADGSRLSGLGEPMLKNLKLGEIVQFERRFFARLDEKKKDMLIFWYLHK